MHYNIKIDTKIIVNKDCFDKIVPMALGTRLSVIELYDGALTSVDCRGNTFAFYKNADKGSYSFDDFDTELTHIINHIRDRSYMGGIERDQTRIKSTGEVFTPTPLVQEILSQLDINLFKDPTKTFLDPSCGDGQFLGEVIIRKIENGSTFEQALSTTYGVDLMPDNVKLCQDRLLCNREDLRHIVEKNIVCADALKYHYRFDNSHPYDDEIKSTQTTDLFNTLFG